MTAQANGRRAFAKIGFASRMRFQETAFVMNGKYPKTAH